MEKDFKTKAEALKHMKSLGLGEISKSKYNWSELTFTISEENPRDTSFDLSFESEDDQGFYYYTIENHDSFCRFKMSKTNKNKMITGAITGNLDLFIEYFVNTKKMVDFSLSEAIIHGNWNIVEYTIKRLEIHGNLCWIAIRYNQVEILNNLLDLDYKLPKNWLAYCMYNDSVDVAKELLLIRKYHLNFKKSELETSWYKREINKNKDTSKLVKNLMYFIK